jgi:hypothetical protein
MYKIIGADQKEYGPITADQLRKWISEGRINAATKVLPEGATAWKSVSELPEFAPSLPVAAPPVPGMPVTIAMTPPVARTNQLAVWAMVTGIMSLLCCQILGPVPLILGIVAYAQIKKNPHEKGLGFAITGIVLGILALFVLVACVLFFLSFPQYLSNFQNAFQNQ